MSTKLQPLFRILVLSCGLISCNSDISEAPSEPNSTPLKVEIANLDGTYQRIQETQQLSVTSSIPIEIAKEQLNDSKIQIRTRCLSSFHNDEMNHKVEFQGQSQIAVVDILPAQAFSPARQESANMRCHINMEIFIHDSLKAQVSLENISIEEAQNYSNDNWELIQSEVETYFPSQTLREVRLKFEADDGEASLLCDTNAQKIFFNHAEVPLTHLINDSLFNGSNLSLCRLVVRDLKGQKTRVSRSFHLQNHIPEVETYFEYDLKADNSMTLRGRPLANFYVKNTSPAAAYIKFANNKSTMTLTATYFNNSRTKFIKGNVLSLPAIWQVAGVSKFDVVHSTKNVDILKIQPGDSLIFQLFAQQDVSCQQPPLGVNTSLRVGPLCGKTYLLAGFISSVSNGPQIEINLFSDFNSPTWKNMSDNKSPSTLAMNNLWSLNERGLNSCQNLPNIAQIKDMKPLDEVNPYLKLICKAH